MIIENVFYGMNADSMAMEIYNNPEIYIFLTSYYADDLSDPYFAREIEQADNPKLFICEQMAAWLPWEKHGSEIMANIETIQADFTSQPFWGNNTINHL